MTRLGTILSIGLLAAAAAAFAVFAFSAGSSADTGGQNRGGAGAPQAITDPDAVLAIAIGQLYEDGEDEEATVDLRAHTIDGETAGSFRFFSEEYGYYNGGVRTLAVSDGVITATGAGGLFPPEGGRTPVRYTAVFDSNTGHAEITVKARDFEYTMAGDVNGLIWAGHPMDQNAPAAP